MKKVVSISLVIVILMFSLLLLSSGTAWADGTVTSPHFQATATPLKNQPNRLPPGGLVVTPTPTANQPNTLPQGGGERTDESGVVIFIGLGSVLLVTGLVLSYRRRRRA